MQQHQEDPAWVLSCFSHVGLFATPGTEVCQAPLTMGFSRQEYWSGLPCPPQGNLPNSGIEPTAPVASETPALQADSLPTETPGKLLSKTNITENVGKMAMVMVCHPLVAKHLNLWHFRSSPTHELCRGRLCHLLEKLKMRDRLTFPTSFRTKMQAHEASCAKETQWPQN